MIRARSIPRGFWLALAAVLILAALVLAPFWVAGCVKSPGEREMGEERN